MRVEGVVTATLGHGLKGDVIEHSYLGSSNVLDDLAQLRGWSQGHVFLEPSSARRDPATNMIVSIQ